MARTRNCLRAGRSTESSTTCNSCRPKIWPATAVALADKPPIANSTVRLRIGEASMLSALYNLLWYPALPFALMAVHPASMRDYRERMGHGDFPDTAGAPRIWIHAASVGEIEAIRPVANGLLEQYPRAVRSFLERVQPSVVLITETEIWPNYFIESARTGAAIAVVNGRMSERS